MIETNQIISAEQVGLRFEECVSVLRRLPGGVCLEYKSFWPDIRYSRDEIALMEKKKITVVKPSPEAIDRAEECLSWITWVNDGERNLIWLRAKSISWRGIARETGYPKTSAQRYWFIALGKIVGRLKEKRTGVE